MPDFKVFDQAIGSVIGSYLSISPGDIINSITCKIGHAGIRSGSRTTNGRVITACIVKDQYFNPDDFDYENLWNDDENNPLIFPTDISSKATDGWKLVLHDDRQIPYINTQVLPEMGSNNKLFDFTFSFNTDNLNMNKVFFCIVSLDRRMSAPDEAYYDCDTASLVVGMNDAPAMYFFPWSVLQNDMRLTRDNGCSVYMNSSITHLDDTTSEGSESTYNSPGKIVCSEIKYRTWSQLKQDSNNKPYYDNNDINFENINNVDFIVDDQDSRNSKNGWCDGGERENDITLPPNSTAIENTNNNFANKFDIPEGRLSDVSYGSPNQYGSSAQPRWVFKRSRIMFTIRPAIINGNPVRKKIKIRYKIETGLPNKELYKNEYKICEYSLNEATNNINIVICPRDEGVLDNSPFKVIFERAYVNGSVTGNWSESAIYYFQTYQRPIVNIAYPKIIRNSATEEVVGSDGKKFRRAKVIATSMYGNFFGEDDEVNKNVCDALTILIAPPARDGSNIPLFTRFFIGEYRFGRTGSIHSDDNKTALGKYQSRFNVYTTYNEILSGDTYDQTAFMTGIHNGNESPILLCGRFKENQLKDVGKKYKLWTYRTWDYVCSQIKPGETGFDDLEYSKDPVVPNAWPLYDEQGNLITPENVPDHYGIAAKSGNSYTQNCSKALLFRAGYIYYLRLRMFHGAASGAIYVDTSLNEMQFGLRNYGNDKHSGLYNYEDSYTYGSGNGYPPNDEMYYGEIKPYDDWVGPDDGTSGIAANADNINETYPGFSQVDYTLIDVISPYTSRYNLIAQHPTSTNIGANQWISFDYRHLSKNMAGIDNYHYDENAKTNVHGFGKTIGNIDNTFTRICGMYKTCVDYIVNKVRDVYGTTPSEGITDIREIIYGDQKNEAEAYANNSKNWPDPTARNFSNFAITSSIERLQIFIENFQSRQLLNILPKNLVMSHKKIISDANNVIEYIDTESTIPLVDVDGIEDAKFGTHNSIYIIGETPYYYEGTTPEDYEHPGSALAQYQKWLDNDPNNPYITPKNEQGNAYLGNYPEHSIIYRAFPNNQGILYDEIYGNSYRWSPVINAVDSNNNEIQIKGQNFKDYGLVKTKYTLISTEPGDDFYNDINNRVSYQNAQFEYYYNDVNTINPNMSTNAQDYSSNGLRFNIKEFAGIDSTSGGEENPHPAMYTTQNNIQNGTQISPPYIKYFNNDEANINSYGKLYLRVPAHQDCENGIITKNISSTNSNLSSLISVNNNIPKEADGKENDLKEVPNNIFSTVRVTHYLYFKTWINVAFRVKISAKTKWKCDYEYIYGYDEKGNPIYRPGTWNFDPWFGIAEDGSYNKFYYLTSNKEIVPPIKHPNYRVQFGDKTGLVEVYGEDNNSWGRCLSNDDLSSRIINSSTGEFNERSTSGGLELPILVRYTPLLQPKLVNSTFTNGSGGSVIISPGGIQTRIKYYRNYHKDTSECNPDTCLQTITSWTEVTPVIEIIKDGEWVDGNSSQEVKAFDLNICYPFIAENGTFYTNLANGGIGNIEEDPTPTEFGDYHIDIDTRGGENIYGDNASSTTNNETPNTDFLGGYGICTGYTVLLVPSDPDLSDYQNSGDINNQEYFRNTSEHWNYFKQPSNYYNDISNKNNKESIWNITSKTQKNARTVVLAYKYAANVDKTSYLSDGILISDKFKSHSGDDLGRCFATIKFDIKKLLSGEILSSITGNEDDNVNELKNILSLDNKEGYNLLKTGVRYDLVIVPIYDNRLDTSYNYLGYDKEHNVDYCGTINGQYYGGGQPDSKKDISYAGSNPLVIYNYLTITSSSLSDGWVEDDGSNTNDLPSYIEDVDEEMRECDECGIMNEEHAIIFPNIDNNMFNTNGDFENIDINKNDINKDNINKDNINFEDIHKLAYDVHVKESPGFWLNNSFRLVLRLPAFRTEATKLSSHDLNTIEQQSNGILTSANSSNDFQFADIQIHIGKIEELKPYGYPNKMNDENVNNTGIKGLNHITSKQELGELNIVSYRYWWNRNVFSKKLSNYFTNNDLDPRDMCTGGALTPDTIRIDNDGNKYYDYKNRFIEVNLSNAQVYDKDKQEWVPVYTKYKEGYYIQFRWLSAYGDASDGQKWSDWHGGSIDGGKNWWGDKGLSYYVPIRNYNDIYTDFRNYIKESFPGSLIENKLVGKGTETKFGSYDINSETNPQNASTPPYYFVGVGNMETKVNKNLTSQDDSSTTAIVPNNNSKHDIKGNNDNVYEETIQYLVSHHNKNEEKNEEQFKIPENVSNLHQHMWEMLYVDYVVRNMCKLYYKPKYNYTYESKDFENYTLCHLAVPWTNNVVPVLDWKTWGYDDMEYPYFENSNEIEKYQGKQSDINRGYVNDDDRSKGNINNNRTTGPRQGGPAGAKQIIQKWNRNKYYRKPITMQDFEELNRHLKDLVTFLRNENICGIITNDTMFANEQVVPVEQEKLEFVKSRRRLIGHDLTENPGVGNTNNINHTMMSTNYIQNIWNNIKTIMKPGLDGQGISDKKTNI